VLRLGRVKRRTRLIVETALAPSAWACYLINGDASVLTSDERAACDAFIARMGFGWPLDCEDYGFTRWHDAFQECRVSADCQRYTFLVRP
jgi:hypothetical protein